MCFSSLILFFWSVLLIVSTLAVMHFLQCLGCRPFSQFYLFFVSIHSFPLFCPHPSECYSIGFNIPCIVHHWPIVLFHQILSVRPFVTQAITHFNIFSIPFYTLFFVSDSEKNCIFLFTCFEENSSKTFLVFSQCISLSFHAFSPNNIYFGFETIFTEILVMTYKLS
jgi:hypothetical protein